MHARSWGRTVEKRAGFATHTQGEAACPEDAEHQGALIVARPNTIAAENPVPVVGICRWTGRNAIYMKNAARRSFCINHALQRVLNNTTRKLHSQLHSHLCSHLRSQLRKENLLRF